MSEFSDIPRDITAADLPKGETVLWRGKPDWRHLALDAFRAPWVVFYFVAIGIWHLATALHDGGSRAEALAAASAVILPMLLALGLVALLAWLAARAAVFTLTDRRIVMRYGVALPALVNVPLTAVESLKLRRGFGGNGDIAFSLPRAGRLSFHQIWPYARPWHLFPASPMLRSVPDAARVAEIFADAARAAAERETATSGRRAEQPAQPQPSGVPDYGAAAPAAA
jgi:hypothetical protein